MSLLRKGLALGLAIIMFIPEAYVLREWVYGRRKSAYLLPWWKIKVWAER